MTRLVFEILRPYRGWLVIVFVAMLIEIGMGLAAPWPLKLVIDDALGNHHLPHWLDWAHEYGGFGKHTLGVALFAGAATLAIAVVGAIASYIDNYFTTSVGQWVANDLRLRVYEHLHRLSLRYYDHAKIGALVSTITSDVATIQDFASSSTLDIVIDLITIVFMVGLMFWLDWDFTLIAIAFTPVLLAFVFHFKKAVKEAKPHLEALVNYLLKMPTEMLLPPGYTDTASMKRVRAVKVTGKTASIEDLIASGVVIIGSPETVREKLAEYQDLAGFNTSLTKTQFGTMPNEMARANMTAIAEEILPHFRERLPQRAAKAAAE